MQHVHNKELDFVLADAYKDILRVYVCWWWDTPQTLMAEAALCNLGRFCGDVHGQVSWKCWPLPSILPWTPPKFCWGQPRSRRLELSTVGGFLGFFSSNISTSWREIMKRHSSVGRKWWRGPCTSWMPWVGWCRTSWQSASGRGTDYSWLALG